jgi:hypothetical protein
MLQGVGCNHHKIFEMRIFVMPIYVEWANETHTLIEMRFQRRWTWAEVATAKQQVDALLDQQHSPVNLLVCGDTSNWLPDGYLDNALRLTRNIHPNIGLIVIVTANPLFEQLFRVFTALTGKLPIRVIFVRTLDEANNTLQPPAVA